MSKVYLSRTAVQSLAQCIKCGAKKGNQCTTLKGDARESNHAERVYLANQAIVDSATVGKDASTLFMYVDEEVRATHELDQTMSELGEEITNILGHIIRNAIHADDKYILLRATYLLNTVMGDNRLKFDEWSEVLE